MTTHSERFHPGQETGHRATFTFLGAKMKNHKVDVIITKEPPRFEDFLTVKEFNEMRMESVDKAIKKIYNVPKRKIKD